MILFSSLFLKNFLIIDWVQNLLDPDFDITVKDIKKEPSCYLISEEDIDNSPMEALKSIYQKIFKIEMDG